MNKTEYVEKMYSICEAVIKSNPWLANQDILCDHDDLLQEAVIHFTINRPLATEVLEKPALTYHIVKNTMRNIARSYKRKGKSDVTDYMDDETLIQEEDNLEKEQELLEELYNYLSDHQSAIVVDYFFFGKTLKELQSKFGYKNQMAVKRDLDDAMRAIEGSVPNIFQMLTEVTKV